MMPTIEEQQSATTPGTKGEALLRKVDRRDKVMRLAEIAILFALVLFNVFTAVRLQNVIDQNQADTLQAREANIARQDELKDYIKCVLLIRYDVPPEHLTTRDGAEQSLDTCAANSKPH
jgi:hypothetical protein